MTKKVLRDILAQVATMQNTYPDTKSKGFNWELAVTFNLGLKNDSATYHPLRQKIAVTDKLTVIYKNDNDTPLAWFPYEDVTSVTTSYIQNFNI